MRSFRILYNSSVQQRSPLHSQSRCGAISTAHYPIARIECMEDVVSFYLFKTCYVTIGFFRSAERFLHRYRMEIIQKLPQVAAH